MRITLKRSSDENRPARTADVTTLDFSDLASRVVATHEGGVTVSLPDTRGLHAPRTARLVFASREECETFAKALLDACADPS